MIPPQPNMKTKTNFTIDWIVKSHTDSAVKPKYPKDYDTEICKALRLPISPPLDDAIKPTSPSAGSPHHHHQLSPPHMQHPSHHPLPIPSHFTPVEESSFERTSPVSLNELNHHQQSTSPIHHPAQHHLNHQPSTHLHSHQRPAPYRPIPFPHGPNYGAIHPHMQPLSGGPNAPSSGPGPIRTGGPTGGLPENDLMVAQLQFIAAMSYRQQQQQQQMAAMQPSVGQPPMPMGHPSGQHPSGPMMNTMYGHPAQHFHGDATVAYPLAPWLMSRHGRLMPRAYPHDFFLHTFRKQKRVRTAFAPLQLLKLEHAFEDNQYVVGTERKQLAKNLNLSETQVKVWFQNRRTKHKRMSQEEGGSNASADDKSNGRDCSLDDIDLEDDCCDEDDEDDVISVIS